MRNAGLAEAQTAIKIARININNLRYADDTTLILAVQGTLKSVLQQHSSKASILWRSAFFYSPTFTSIYDYRKKT